MAGDGTGVAPAGAVVHDAPRMKIVTWNVNGIRPRLERLLAWTEEHAPDVLCLQETKVEDDAFPRAAFEERGFHVAAHGQKTYNGVAIISRETPTELMYGFPDDGPDADRRLLAATFGMLRVYCAYVPNGQTPESDQFATKLDWLRRLHDHVDATCGRRTRILLAGDDVEWRRHGVEIRAAAGRASEW